MCHSSFSLDIPRLVETLHVHTDMLHVKSLILQQRTPYRNPSSIKMDDSREFSWMLVDAWSMLGSKLEASAPQGVRARACGERPQVGSLGLEGVSLW